MPAKERRNEESTVMKSGVFGLLVAATCAVGLSANSARASVVYSLSGTDVNQFGGGIQFSFVYTSPTFITTSTLGVTPDSCSIGSPNFTCSTENFLPNTGGHDYIEFGYNAVGGGGGSGTEFFPVGDFATPGAYPSSDGFSPDALLTVTVSQTPLPAALPLFAAGLGVVGALARRRKRKASDRS
jgi:hypothetical protein